jgi:hypothetical protein
MIHATVFAKDQELLVTFYRQFGFVPTLTEPDDVAVLTDGDCELTIVSIPPHISRDIEISSPPQVRSQTPIKLTFIVAALDDALERAQHFGGSTADFKRWSMEGFDIQDCVDPEGNVFQLRQPV